MNARRAGAGFAIAALFGALWPMQAAYALSEGKTLQGGAYLSGGIALGERDALEQRREAFSLRVATAAKKSGAYLADVRLKITDEAGRPVLETRLDGPWLLVQLELGRYRVEASFESRSLHKTTTIHPGDHHEMLFYFDVDVDTLPADAKR